MCTLTCVVVYLSMCSTCVCVNNRLCTVNKNLVSQVCAPPSTDSLPHSLPTMLELLTTLCSMWCVHLLVPLVLSFKDYLQRTSNPPREVRWRPAAVTCPSAGSEWRGHKRGLELVHRVGGGAEVSHTGGSWSSAGHCRQHSECLVPSEVPSTGGGAGDGLVLLCPYVRCPSHS